MKKGPQFIFVGVQMKSDETEKQKASEGEKITDGKSIKIVNPILEQRGRGL